MKKKCFPVLMFFLATVLAACGGDELASPVIQEALATATQTTATQTTVMLATPADSPTIPPSHDFLMFGVKTVIYSMSDYAASQQKVPLNQYVEQHTDIFSYSVETKTTQLVFSDKSLPVFILNTSGGGETAIHDIVATDPGSGKIYARMIARDQYTEYEAAGGLYQLSTDGSNTYTKLFNFDGPDNFQLSPDSTKIASLSGNSLVIRALDSGKEISRIDLEAFKDNWIRTISWAPDGKTILVDVTEGDASVTPAAPYSQTVGCYLVNIQDKTIQKLSAAVFQSPLELTPGFKTDPSSFTFFPQSNRLIGMAREYNTGDYSVELLSVALDGSQLVLIPIGNNKSVWEFMISPDGQYVAYPCLLDICSTHLPDGRSEIASRNPLPPGGVEQEQTVIGWLEK
jgi:WD40 repeat protein